MGGPDTNTDRLKQSISAVRASEGFPGNEFSPNPHSFIYSYGTVACNDLPGHTFENEEAGRSDLTRKWKVSDDHIVAIVVHFLHQKRNNNSTVTKLARIQEYNIFVS